METKIKSFKRNIWRKHHQFSEESKIFNNKLNSLAYRNNESDIEAELNTQNALQFK